MTDKDQPATKSDLLELEHRMEVRMDGKFATKDDLKNDLATLEQRIDHKFDTFMDAISDKFTELRDHFDATIEHIDHDLIKPLHDKIALTDEKVDHHAKRIENLEDRAGISNPFPQ